jgi:hypothetical protein
MLTMDRKSTWSAQDTSALLHQVILHNTDWATIASHVSGHTPEECAAWFSFLEHVHTYFRQRKKAHQRSIEVSAPISLFNRFCVLGSDAMHLLRVASHAHR